MVINIHITHYHTWSINKVIQENLPRRDKYTYSDHRQTFAAFYSWRDGLHKFIIICYQCSKPKRRHKSFCLFRLRLRLREATLLRLRLFHQDGGSPTKTEAGPATVEVTLSRQRVSYQSGGWLYYQERGWPTKTAAAIPWRRLPRQGEVYHEAAPTRRRRPFPGGGCSTRVKAALLMRRLLCQDEGCPAMHEPAAALANYFLN
jgi:hypothetical protein